MYVYDYLGSTTRIVITPLTYRCWMTLTGAINFKYGVTLQGPFGTGKTESCKDLVKALGRFFIQYLIVQIKLQQRLWKNYLLEQLFVELSFGQTSLIDLK